MTATAPTATVCAGPDCTTSMEGRPATVRYCGEQCRKAAYRDRVRAQTDAVRCTWVIFTECSLPV
jgi:hypothetical protein